MVPEIPNQLKINETKENGEADYSEEETSNKKSHKNK